MMRDLLPQLNEIVYLNYGATAPLLLPSAEKMRALISQSEEPFQFHRNEWFSHLERARLVVANLIHASQNEIAFVPNTSSGLSLIANAIPWKKGDRILFPADEFPSNRYVWMNLQKKGVYPEPIEPSGSFLKQLEALDLANVRLIALSAVSYCDGRREEIEEIGKLCKSKGILLAIDAIQAIGAIPIDVRSLECDFLVSGGQKWLFGPIGSGFIYINQKRIEDLFVPQVGWASVENIRDFEGGRLEFTTGARRFEPALSDIPAIAALATSIETMGSIGWEKIYSRIAQLTETAANELTSLGFSVLTPPKRAGIITFETPDAEKIQQKLLEEKIFVTHRKNQIRLSLHAPVSDDDLSKLFETLSGTQKSIRCVFIPSRTQAKPAERRKKALVTGAGRGLGAAISTALEKKGYEVLPITRDRLDLSNAENVNDFQPGEIDLLINCAVEAAADLFHESMMDKSRQNFEVNFWTPLVLARKVIPGMLQRGDGTIVNIVTTGARCALPLFSIYSASKGALWSWSESLQRELQGTGIDVITFLPPHMDSSTALRLGRKALSFYKFKKPEKQIGPADVAELVMQAIDRKTPFACSWKTRIKLAWNQFCPSSVARLMKKIFSN